MTSPRPKALLIGDDEDSLAILRTLCEEEALAADAAPGGGEAIRRIASEEYAVIILDLQPDGIGLLDYLRGARPDLLQRVVLFTGFSNAASPVGSDLPPVPKADVSSLRYAIRKTIGADAN